MSESKVRNENSFIISGWMINELGLSGNALMIFAIIFGFSQDGESCFTGSRKYLCDFTGATKPTVDKALNDLIDKGYILKYVEKRNDVIYNRYQINLNILNFTGSKESLPPCKETLPNNKVDNKDIKENIIIDNIKESKRFVKPTLEEVQSYINEKGYHFSAQKFIDYYDSVGWKIGKSPMKDWKAACRTWEGKYKDSSNSYNPYKSNKISDDTAYSKYDDVGYLR